MAEARVKKVDIARARGEEVDKVDLAQEVSFVRRRLSQAIVVAFGRRLASRMSQVGQNAQLASRRRQYWRQEEEVAKLTREAGWLERVGGRSIVGRGRFWKGGGT